MVHLLYGSLGQDIGNKGFGIEPNAANISDGSKRRGKVCLALSADLKGGSNGSDI